MWPPRHKGFMVFNRELPPSESPESRVKHFREFSSSLPPDPLEAQAYRCMNCGVPFCHSGCPLGNQIPDFNELVSQDDWKGALEVLLSTNNFPEFTGRICPAPCESACVLGINEPPVTIEMIEKEIADRGWAEGWIRPEPPRVHTRKRIAVVGSGPAGLAAAQQLNRAGHTVVVYERADEPGGLLMYGIPNFKLDKALVRRRIALIEAEGVEFRCNAEVGVNVPLSELEQFDAVLLAIGSTRPRTMADLGVPGADLEGIYPAVRFLTQATKRVLGKPVNDREITAAGRRVVVIGGGDTGSDCVGTSLRQGAASVLNIELFPRPPLQRTPGNPWPEWDFVLRTSSSHQEAPGGDCREWCIHTKGFEDDGTGHVCALHAVRVEWSEPDASGRRQMREIPGSDMRIECDLVLLAMGFVEPEAERLASALGLELEKNRFGRAIQAVSGYATARPGVFVAGDARRGQSLVVWAIAEGREAARQIDAFLMGRSELPARDTMVHGEVMG